MTSTTDRTISGLMEILGRDVATKLVFLTCERCRKLPEPRLGVLVQSDGRRVVKAYCKDCTRRYSRVVWTTSALPKPDQLIERLAPPVLANNIDPRRLCEVCGKTGVQEHHWAPRSIFRDEADRWPTSYLCESCHAEWHRRTGVADQYFRKAAA